MAVKTGMGLADRMTFLIIPYHDEPCQSLIHNGQAKSSR